MTRKSGNTLTVFTAGGGSVEHTGQGWRLTIPAGPGRVYADAQLDDYHTLVDGRPRRQPFAARPPRRLRLRARASHPQPAGTLGFGFWNDPFTLAGGALRAPQCAWFFYASPPSDMALAEQVPGWGWKAATLRSPRVPGLLLLPAAAAAVALTYRFPWGRFPLLQRASNPTQFLPIPPPIRLGLARILARFGWSGVFRVTRLPELGAPVMALARRAVRAHETLLPAGSLAEWHTYELDWQAEAVVFRVDGQAVLRSPAPPPGPLGCVIWIDNQYAIASRQGRFGFGLCASDEPQWLEIEELEVQGTTNAYGL